MSSIFVINMNIIYWSVHSSNRRGRNRRIVIITLLEYMIIWCKTQVIINPLPIASMCRISLLLIEISLVLMFVFTDGKLYYQPFLVGWAGGGWLGLINCLRLILKSTGRGEWWGEGVNTYFPFHLFKSNLYSFCVG